MGIFRKYPLSRKIFAVFLIVFGTGQLALQLITAPSYQKRFLSHSYEVWQDLRQQEIGHLQALDRATKNCLNFVKNRMLNFNYHSQVYQTLRYDRQKLKLYRRQLKLLAAKILAEKNDAYNLRFFVLPYFIFQTLWLMLVASGILLLRSGLELALNFSYFSLIFAVVASWLVNFSLAFFVLNSPALLWLKSFNRLIHEISPQFSSAFPFSFFSLSHSFLAADGFFWAREAFFLALLLVFVGLAKFSWRRKVK